MIWGRPLVRNEMCPNEIHTRSAESEESVEVLEYGGKLLDLLCFKIDTTKRTIKISTNERLTDKLTGSAMILVCGGTDEIG